MSNTQKDDSILVVEEDVDIGGGWHYKALWRIGGVCQLWNGVEDKRRRMISFLLAEKRKKPR